MRAACPGGPSFLTFDEQGGWARLGLARVHAQVHAAGTFTSAFVCCGPAASWWWRQNSTCRHCTRISEASKTRITGVADRLTHRLAHPLHPIGAGHRWPI